MRRVLVGCFLFLVVACTFSKEGQLRKQGGKVAKELAQILSEIETHEELQAATPRLKKKFNYLADLVIEVKVCREKRGQDFFLQEPTQESDALFAELARLYEIPGCREIIEGAQKEAVAKLYRK